MPNIRKTKVLLPSNLTKTSVFNEYIDKGFSPISLRTFQRLWSELCPNILFSSPKSDLCSKCQHLTYQIGKEGNLSENEKLKTLQVYNEHLEKVKHQRDQYKKSVLAAKAVYQSSAAVEGNKIQNFKGNHCACFNLFIF